jgi:hypothetical protein
MVPSLRSLLAPVKFLSGILHSSFFLLHLNGGRPQGPLNIENHWLSNVIMRASVAIGVAFLTGLCRMSCQGEEDHAVTRPNLFRLPPIKLRDESGPKPPQPERALSKQPTLSLRAEPVAVDSPLSYDLNSSIIPNSGFHLPRSNTSSNTGGWAYIDGLFKPEVIGIGNGKASFSCPFVTVIKRKNPLCLLSGLGNDGEGRLAFILLKVSW